MAKKAFVEPISPVMVRDAKGRRVVTVDPEARDTEARRRVAACIRRMQSFDRVLKRSILGDPSDDGIIRKPGMDKRAAVPRNVAPVSAAYKRPAAFTIHGLPERARLVLRADKIGARVGRASLARLQERQEAIYQQSVVEYRLAARAASAARESMKRLGFPVDQTRVKARTLASEVDGGSRAAYAASPAPRVRAKKHHDPRKRAAFLATLR